MNSVINILTKLGVLKDDLDYHFIRLSMVIIFLFFGYQKWFEYEAQTLIPHQQRPAYFLDVPGLWNSRRELVFGRV